MAHQYKDHNADSAKGKVHEVYDNKGKEAAMKKAAALDIAPTTARTWCSSWKNASPKKKKAKAAEPAKASKPKKASAASAKPKAKAKVAAKPKAKAKVAAKPKAKREKLEERASA